MYIIMNHTKSPQNMDDISNSIDKKRRRGRKHGRGDEKKGRSASRVAGSFGGRMVLRRTCEWLLLALILQVAALHGGHAQSGVDESELPIFVEDVPNVTVTLSRDALLSCTVEQLRGYKVAWVQVDTQTILTIHKNVITRNPRINLLHSDHRSWHLQIKNLRESDRGWYMCQVNTDPMRFRQGYVDVVVPPDIIDKESSGDMTVREGDNVTLTCRAKGHPEPTIVWRREDHNDITLEPDKTTQKVEGETLTMLRVSRLQMGTYLCIASNGIPPSVSKRVELHIQFPPMAWVPQQLEGAYVGQELTIKCHTEASPKSINYWTNANGDMVVSGDRYEAIVADSSYKVYMKLRIKSVQKEDFGTYKCMAKNSLGETDGSIKIYEIEPPNTVSTNLDLGEVDVVEGPIEPSPTEQQHTRKGEGRKKYESYRKGINDINGAHHDNKIRQGKTESGHSSTKEHMDFRNFGYSPSPDDAPPSGPLSLILVFSCVFLSLVSLHLQFPTFAGVKEKSGAGTAEGVKVGGNECGDGVLRDEGKRGGAGGGEEEEIENSQSVPASSPSPPICMAFSAHHSGGRRLCSTC